MSAPVLWIFLPTLAGGILLLVRNQKLLSLLAGILCALLAIAALLLPIESPLNIQAWTFKIQSSFNILGRSLVLTDPDRAWLVLIFGAAAFWFTPAASIQIARRMVPLGLVITSLLVAALAVEPFLYAALLIQTAVLLSVPLLSPPGSRPGKGILRFLIYQTIAMAFILFSGWLLSGMEANPGDLLLVTRAATLLGLGFALLLAVFPFYTWIPLLSAETHPFVAGFILWSFPTVSLFFGLGFLERYAWLRESDSLLVTLITAGVVMIFFGGVLAFFQRNLGRMLAYAVMVETGFSLVSLGLGGEQGFQVFLLLCLPRLISLALCSLGLSILHQQAPSLDLDDLQGVGRAWVAASAAVVLAAFSLAGLPLLASFPPHLAIWEGLARQSLGNVIWVFLGSLGLTLGAVRVLVSLAAAPENTPWIRQETWAQRLFLITGCALLLLLGTLPSWMSAFWFQLPALFEHLGQ